MPEVKKDAGEAPRKKIWIVVGDVHEKPDNINKIPELAEAEGIIVTGDLTNGGGADDAARVLAALEATGKPVLAQVGNMDKMDVDAWLDQKGVNLHRKTRELAPGVAVFGVGGSTPTPMHTPTEFTEEEYADWLDKEWALVAKYAHKVLVSHNPPKDTPCDAINPRLHVGSTAVRDFIEKHSPDVCLCGHVHEGRATTELAGCGVINPGQLAEGGYAVLSASADGVEARLANVKS